MCIFILAHNRFDFPRDGAIVCGKTSTAFAHLYIQIKYNVEQR